MREASKRGSALFTKNCPHSPTGLLKVGMEQGCRSGRDWRSLCFTWDSGAPLSPQRTSGGAAQGTAVGYAPTQAPLSLDIQNPCGCFPQRPGRRCPRTNLPPGCFHSRGFRGGESRPAGTGHVLLLQDPTQVRCLSSLRRGAASSRSPSGGLFCVKHRAALELLWVANLM